MARLVFILTACVAFVDTLNNFLVQGRADTLRVLKKIIREREDRVMPHDPFAAAAPAWSPEPIFTEVVPREVTVRQLQSAIRAKRLRRDISNAVIESGRCEHIDLMDCSDFESDEMTCMITATGMTCCVCTGTLRASKWNVF